MMEDWVGYFQTIAGASAALFGLAFVAYQVKSKAWQGDVLGAPLAWLALWESVTPMFFALLLLLPVKPWVDIQILSATPPWIVSGWIIGGFGYLLISWKVFSYIKYIRIAESYDHIQAAVSLILVITFGILIFSPHLEAKAAVILWMLFSGIGESWIALKAADRRLKPPRRERQGRIRRG